MAIAVLLVGHSMCTGGFNCVSPEASIPEVIFA